VSGGEEPALSAVGPAEARAVAETGRFLTRLRDQWRWPTEQRWAIDGREHVLVSAAPRAAAPAILVDGRPVAGEAWTIWRIRVPAAAPW
jgi:hypothetical protein